MKTAILEKTNFNANQIAQLEKLGSVDWYDGLTDEQAASIAPNYDVVVVNWIDPSPFLLKMHSGSLVALLSTGYGWIGNMTEARKKGIFVAHIPQYSTESVAERNITLMLGACGRVFHALNKPEYKAPGVDLQGKTVGIIGLGNIGSRVASILQAFNVNVITYNRSKKNSPLAKDVSLDELLSNSDIICITCSQNSESKNLINLNNYQKIKHGAIIVGTTWGIVEETAIVYGVKEEIIETVAFDAAYESGDKISSPELKALLNEGTRIFFTPHSAFNTVESEARQLDTCVNNIVSFAIGEPVNIVN